MYYILVLLVFTSQYCYSAVGCMSNTRKLDSDAFDYKQFHYVSCACPCQRYVTDTGVCARCGHIRPAA